MQKLFVALQTQGLWTSQRTSVQPPGSSMPDMGPMVMALEMSKIGSLGLEVSGGRPRKTGKIERERERVAEDAQTVPRSSCNRTELAQSLSQHKVM